MIYDILYSFVNCLCTSSASLQSVESETPRLSSPVGACPVLPLSDLSQLPSVTVQQPPSQKYLVQLPQSGAVVRGMRVEKPSTCATVFSVLLRIQKKRWPTPFPEPSGPKSPHILMQPRGNSTGH